VCVCITLADTTIITASTDCGRSRMLCDLRPKSTSASFAVFTVSNPVNGKDTCPLYVYLPCIVKVAVSTAAVSPTVWCV
jgi:hypothetical protein